jgi:glyoxylase-like metal-dependent hydrolase (beta-lactamase superfamily II)
VSRLDEIAPGVFVATSELLLTTTTVIARSGACAVVDPAVTVDELESLVLDLNKRRLHVELGVATHPHWDHVLWSRGLGEVPRVAAPRAVVEVSLERTALLGEAASCAPGHDLELFARLVALEPGATALPWHGVETELVIHDAHAAGHLALFLPELGVLIAGDMCSDVEVPLLDLAGDDPLGDYRLALERLAGLAGVRTVVPGHGHVGDAADFHARIEADRRYLDSLDLGRPFDDPRCAEPWLRREHDRQLTAVHDSRR